jgi:hypothetical protein
VFGVFRFLVVYIIVFQSARQDHTLHKATAKLHYSLLIIARPESYPPSSLSTCITLYTACPPRTCAVLHCEHQNGQCPLQQSTPRPRNLPQQEIFAHASKVSLLLVPNMQVCAVTKTTFRWTITRFGTSGACGRALQFDVCTLGMTRDMGDGARGVV